MQTNICIEKNENIATSMRRSEIPRVRGAVPAIERQNRSAFHSGYGSGLIIRAIVNDDSFNWLDRRFLNGPQTFPNCLASIKCRYHNG